MALCSDPRLYNIIVLGICFMLIFAAFQTCSMVEKTVLDSVENFGGSGYTSLGILYVSFSLSNFISPSVVSLCGPKVSMIAGSVTYFLFVFSFLKPMVWSLYVGSVVVGIGAAVLWTAQGNFLTINSNEETVSRNSGIFWALFQSSLLIGNLYSYFVFKGKAQIDKSERTHLFIALSGAALLGGLCFFLLRNKRPKVFKKELDSVGNVINNTLPEETIYGPLEAFKRSIQLLKTKEILLLCFAFFYTGIELTFFQGVYGTCISHNVHFGSDRNGLLGISGIFIGVGEIFGGCLFGLLGHKTNKYGRDIIVMLGYVLHMIAFFGVFVYFPQKSPIEESGGATYFPSNVYIALTISFLLGFGDSAWNTQLFSILGSVYSDDSSPAFALFKFVQSVAAAIGFYYSNVLLLQWQLVILVGMGTIGSLTFCLVEWDVTRASRRGYSAIGEE